MNRTAERATELAAVHVSIRLEATISVRLPPDADEIDAETLRDTAVREWVQGRLDDLSAQLGDFDPDTLEVEWADSVRFAPRKPGPVPEEAWIKSDGRRWAFNQVMLIRDDCPPLPRLMTYRWFVGDERPTAALGVYLGSARYNPPAPGYALATVEQDEEIGWCVEVLRTVAEPRYCGGAAYFYRDAEDLPVAVVMLRRDQEAR